jgi:hypothetical protein
MVMAVMDVAASRAELYTHVEISPDPSSILRTHGRASLLIAAHHPPHDVDVLPVKLGISLGEPAVGGDGARKACQNDIGRATAGSALSTPSHP